MLSEVGGGGLEGCGKEDASCAARADSSTKAKRVSEIFRRRPLFLPSARATLCISAGRSCS